MDADNLITEYAIPDPCPMNWDQMGGDERVRFCAVCGKHMHDLTTMTPEESRRLAVSRNQPRSKPVTAIQREEEES